MVAPKDTYIPGTILFVITNPYNWEAPGAQGIKGKYVDLGPDYLYDLIEVRQHNKKADIILSVGIDLVLGTRQTCIPYNFRVCA